MSRQLVRERPTLGVLAGYQVYEGIVQGFLEPLYQGIYAAAHDRACNLLLACGMGHASPAGNTLRPMHPAWPCLSADSDFVPVGVDNTDGLIIARPVLAPPLRDYVGRIVTCGHPRVFVAAGSERPTVCVDNEGGMRQAVTHLIMHHHRRIAFIAGREDDSSDGRCRLQAFVQLSREYGLDCDSRLIAHGMFTAPGGYWAMRRILESGVTFTAVLAGNDESATGVIRALQEAGLRVPQDIALIGFDDRLEAVAQHPPLTTIHYSIFEAGYQAVLVLLRQLESQDGMDEVMHVPTRLVVRESCGCRPGLSPIPDLTGALAGPGLASASSPVPTGERDQLAQVVREVVSMGVRQLSDAQVLGWCRQLVDDFLACLQGSDPAAFRITLEEILARVEEKEDDPYPWLIGLSTLHARLSMAGDGGHASLVARAADMLNQAQVHVAGHLEQRYSRYLVQRGQVANQIGLMATRLLTTLDEGEILSIFAEYLPEIGIRSGQVVLFEPEGDDPVAWSRMPDGADGAAAARFPTGQFPSPGLCPPDKPFQLALLPLVFQDEARGYVAFDAGNLEPCAAIVRQLAGALQGARLHRDAIQGRQLAEEANRMKSHSLTVVSHELLKPLHQITLRSEMLLRQSPSGHTADIEKIHASARHLGSLTGDVLDLASSDAGHLHLACEPVDPLAMLEMVRQAGAELARERNLQWHEECAPSLPLVWGDRTRLQQVALNLVDNAVKFTPAGRVSLRAHQQGDHVVIAVSDTGPGISPDEQDAIFDEFRQSERTARRGSGGLGLGLAIARRLVELHGGQIGVRSSIIDEGSTFFFSLPIMSAQPLPPGGELPPTAQRVLVLAAPEGADWLCARLRAQGFDVEERRAGPGAEWLDGLGDNPPGAIVLDAAISAEQSWEALHTLKTHPALQDIQVLYNALSREHNAGISFVLEYLPKLVDVGEFGRMLDRQGLAPEAARAKTILIVDDDAATRELHARLVAALPGGYQALTVAGGREALELLDRTPVALVMLDLMMREMDGFQVLEAMRADENTRHIPVVVLTARVLTEADMARLERDAAKVLRKALFTMEETLAHLQMVLDRNPRLGSETRRQVCKVKAYLEAHYAEKFSREDLAHGVGMSAGYLTECFRAETGLTPRDYQSRCRIDHARLLLERSAKNIAEIAQETGFGESAAFDRAFKRATGRTPRAYRQECLRSGQ